MRNTTICSLPAPTCKRGIVTKKLIRIDFLRKIVCRQFIVFRFRYKKRIIPTDNPFFNAVFEITDFVINLVSEF